MKTDEANKVVFFFIEILKFRMYEIVLKSWAQTVHSVKNVESLETYVCATSFGFYMVLNLIRSIVIRLC